jgi:hypothetical protein
MTRRADLERAREFQARLAASGRKPGLRSKPQRPRVETGPYGDFIRRAIRA